MRGEGMTFPFPAERRVPILMDRLVRSARRGCRMLLTFNFADGFTAGELVDYFVHDPHLLHEGVGDFLDLHPANAACDRLSRGGDMGAGEELAERDGCRCVCVNPVFGVASEPGEDAVEILACAALAFHFREVKGIELAKEYLADAFFCSFGHNVTLYVLSI